VALTVTVTLNASPSVGLGLVVKALTGAAVPASQSGVTFGSDITSSPPQYNPTPVDTGSYIYGATVYQVATAATVDANTTADLNTAATVALFIFRSTGKTTAGSAVTYGGSAPTATVGSFVMAEIVASGTLAEDSSSPAAKSSTTASTLTTASFSPPASCLLMAAACGASGEDQVDTLSISDTAGLTWTRLILSNVTENGAAAIWVATAPGGLSGRTQPKAAVPVPRRGPVRARWASITGRAFVQVPAPRQQPRPAPRRVPARACVRFTPVATVNAAPPSGVAGTVPALMANRTDLISRRTGMVVSY